MTVVIIDELGQGRYYLLCQATRLTAPRLIRAWKRRRWIEHSFRTLKHLLAAEACQVHEEDAYYGHLVWRLLAGLEGVRRLNLGPLPLSEATELLAGILGERAASEGESALGRLAQLCGGLPLALRIAGNRLVSRPGWSAADFVDRLADEERRLDQLRAGDLKVASAFGMSDEQLADSARRVEPARRAR